MRPKTEQIHNKTDVLQCEEDEAFMAWRADAKEKYDRPGYVPTLLRSTIFILFITSYLLLLNNYVQTVRKPMDAGPCVNGLEGIYTDAPLQSYRRVFKQSGFHNPNKPEKPTDYEGEPNAHNDAAWNNAMNVGMIAITEEENARMPRGGSAPLHVNGIGLVKGQYVVQTAVSHQVHCLKRIRDAVWDLAAGRAEDWQLPHADHCIDYIRQAIMCHGDLTPIYFEWRDDHKSFRAEQSNIHQCRSWDAIFQWSLERNTTGLRIDGKHGRKGEKGD